jgi:prefoldin subunit 5
LVSTVDEVLDAEKAAIDEESRKLGNTVNQLMSKLQDIQQITAVRPVQIG